MAEYLKVKIDNKTAVVTLDHAPVNALSPAVLKEIKGTFDELAKNDEVRAISARSGTAPRSSGRTWASVPA